MEQLNTHNPEVLPLERQGFRPERSGTAEEKLSGETLKAYKDAFSYIYDTYGLDERTAKFDFLESIMMLNATAKRVAGPLINWRLKDVLDRYESASNGTPKNRGSEVKAELMNDAKKFVYFAGAMIAGLLSTTVADGMARKSFEKEMLLVRKAINGRVANSVFMREFEFVQDKNPSEILNIIDRGKQGAVNIIHATYTEIIPHLTSIVVSSGTAFGVDRWGGAMGLLRLPILYLTNRKVGEQILVDRKAERAQKDAIDTRVLTSLQSIEVVKSSDTMENAIQELADSMQGRDEIITESKKKHITRDQQKAYVDTMFEDIAPVALAYLFFQERVKRGKDPIGALLLASRQYQVMGGSQRSTGWHAGELMRVFVEKIQPALQDMHQMELLIGPYEALDKPDGFLERARIPVSKLPNFDIQVRNMSYKNILHDISMDIPQGSFVTIKGPSGIGKTTFLRHLLGLFQASSGTVTYGGMGLEHIKKYGDESMYTKLAYANQNPQYFENMTLRENLLLWTKKQVPDAKLFRVLHDLKLDHIAYRMDSKTKHFSGGEMRRIGIARALLKDPKVLFLDEPTANLDEDSANQVLEIIKEVRKNNPDMTVITVTHDPDFEAIAEQIVDFREINRPTESDAALFGNRQVFYAAATSPTKN